VTAQGGQAKGYKRSWKNLLLFKQYQLSFTLVMVGVSALLMIGLGIWVLLEANEATTVAMAPVLGEACPELPTIGQPKSDEDAPVVPMHLDDGTDSPPTDVPSAAPADRDAATGSGTGSAADAGSASAQGSAATREHHVAVQIDESSITLTPTQPPDTATHVPPDFADRIAMHWMCRMKKIGSLDELELGRMRIVWVLILSGLALIIGQAIYGLKMTHRVAGPLFKVKLYFAKMRDGRLDKVYNLRKGDQLVDFYEHFKAAHAGVVALEREDIVQLRALIAAAEQAGQGEHAATGELRALLARKEKSVE